MLLSLGRNISVMYMFNFPQNNTSRKTEAGERRKKMVKQEREKRSLFENNISGCIENRSYKKIKSAFSTSILPSVHSIKLGKYNFNVWDIVYMLKLLRILVSY